MSFRRAIFDWFICLSLFNLLLLRVWAQILPAVVNPANLYYMQRAPHRVHYAAVLLSLFTVSALAAAAAGWARNSRRAWALPLARGGLLLLFLAALNSLRAQLPAELQESALALVGSAGAVGIGGVLFGLLAWLALRHAPRTAALVEVFAIFAAPFLLMTVGQAVWMGIRYEPDRFAGASLADAEPAPVLPPRAPGAPRVVWIVFDELDQHAAFDARPAGLELRELDRMRRESLFARNAYPPAEETRRSLTSMLLGVQVGWAMPDGASTLPCALAGAPIDEPVSDCWREHANLFAKARALGVNAGVAGWYHPYCRLFSESVTSCVWAGLPYWDSPRLVDSLDQQWEEVLDPIPVVGDWPGPGARIRRAHVDAFRTIRAAALRIAADPEIGFALLHLPVPHHPDIYDPDRGTLSVADERSYLDNLELADRTLGELRTAMETADLWSRSAVIVTSDHWWRAIHRGDWGLLPEEEDLFGDGENRRVPFLAKLPGDGMPLVYPRAFNTLLIHELTLEILAGRLRTAAGLAAWLDANRTRAPIPYPVRIPERPAGAAGGV
jgi:hypothetical protein